MGGKKKLYNYIAAENIRLYSCIRLTGEWFMQLHTEQILLTMNAWFSDVADHGSYYWRN